MDKLTEKCFDPASIFFKETSDHLLYPDPDSSAVPQCLKHFEFMGRVLGKAVYDQILLRPQFAAPFLNKLLDRNNVIEDLYTIDPELYKHLLSLKTLAKTDSVDLEDLSLFFTVGTGDKGGVKSEVELIKNGRNIPVTNSNHLEYIYRVAHFKLNSETSRQSKYFLRGFHDLIPVDWIKMFDAHELQMVIGGEQRGIDIENMAKFTSYGGGYHESQPFIQWFWEILTNFTPDQQSDFLKFVTSSSRQPLLGFEFMNPPFCIQKVPLDPAGQKLPTAGTCMSLLKLPPYRDKETMRSKILYAISANSGFELS
jgi:ubiquitin-protein ligase E3 C